jgi:hypothetical protein
LETKRVKTTEEFIKATDFFPKFRAALESIEHGNSHQIFQGIESLGECLIKVAFDGETVHLSAIPCVPQWTKPEFSETPKEKFERMTSDTVHEIEEPSDAKHKRGKPK